MRWRPKCQRWRCSAQMSRSLQMRLTAWLSLSARPCSTAACLNIITQHIARRDHTFVLWPPMVQSSREHSREQYVAIAHAPLSSEMVSEVVRFLLLRFLFLQDDGLTRARLSPRVRGWHCSVCMLELTLCTFAHSPTIDTTATRRAALTNSGILQRFAHLRWRNASQVRKT